MKKTLLFLCAFLLLGLLKAASADEDYKSLSLTCSEDRPLASQLTREIIEKVESLTISGTLWGEDMQAIDQCSHLSYLDLTDATLKEEVTFYDDWEKYVDAIGKNAFSHTAIETLYLPKVISCFDLQALSLFTWDKDCGRQAADWGEKSYTDEPHFEKTITVYVTGRFPDILNPQSISGYYGCPMEFKLTEGNDLYTEVDGNIYSKDGTMLIKAGNLYDSSEKDYTFDIQSVYCFAFTYTLWDYEHQLITFSEKTDHIYASAFAEVAIPYVSPEKVSEHFGGIRFLGWNPPAVGGGFFYVHHTDPDLFPCCKAIVPSKTRYIASNIWWMPYVMDEFEYGVLCGTMSADDKEDFYSRQDKFCPRMDDLNELLGKSVIREAIIEYYTFNGEEEWFDVTATGYLEILLSTIKSIPLIFVNPQTNEKETIEFDFGLERFKVFFKLYGEDGREWEKIDLTNHEDIIPGNPLYYWTKLYFYETAKVGDKCRVSIQLEGKNFFGLLTESYIADGVFKEDALPFNVNYLHRKTDEILFQDLQGRPVDGTQKGILIRNGKKVLVK